MPRMVKVAGTTRVSSKHQVTIPVSALAETGLNVGDRLVVRAAGPGKVVLERIDDVAMSYAGALTGRIERGILEELDTEWD